MNDDASGSLVQPTRFQPTQAPEQGPRVVVTRTQIVLAVVILTVGWFIWFIFTAKSVRFTITPDHAVAEVSGGFRFSLGEVYLLREGAYRLYAEAEGYHPLDVEVGVAEPRNQVFAFEMTKLPGRITFESSPAQATVSIAGDVLGTTPFETPIAAGDHTVLVQAERYQDGVYPLTVEGMDAAQTLRAELRPNWAEVTVPTQPAGASVTVDGVSIDALTPGPIELLAGEHRITLKKSGYKSWTDILRVEAEERLTLPTVQLVQADGLVTVTSAPRGAGITVDGQYRGLTPQEITLTPSRTHRVRVFKMGFAPETRTIRVSSAGEQTVRFDLTALTGELSILTQPEDVELWVDGKPSGRANRTVVLSALPHEIELRKEGYAGYRKTVTPQPGFTQELKVRLLTLEEARLARLIPRIKTAIGQELVLLSPTPVTLGSSRREPGRRANEVLRDVNLTRLFYLGTKEVTNGEFRRFAAGHSSDAFEEQALDKDEQPVVGITWEEAAIYCNWLSAQENLPPFYKTEFGKVVGADPNSLGYRLPTEAEWAWAARTVDGSDAMLRFPWGGKLPPPERQGNYADRSASHLVGRIIFGYNDNYIVAAPVGSFAPNARGIYDMGGNVAEWIHDFYEIPEPGVTLNPLGPAEGDYHVIRGSSWMNGTVTDLRLSFRDYGTEGRQDLGFRIAKFAE